MTCLDCQATCGEIRSTPTLAESGGLRHASTTAAPDRHHNAPMRSAFVRESGVAR